MPFGHMDVLGVTSSSTNIKMCGLASGDFGNLHSEDVSERNLVAKPKSIQTLIIIIKKVLPKV